MGPEWGTTRRNIFWGATFVIGKEMDFGVTNLNIVHVRVLINPKKI